MAICRRTDSPNSSVQSGVEHRPASAWDLLSRRRSPGPVTWHFPSTRSPNATAIAAGYDEAILTIVSWNVAFPASVRRAYYAGLSSESLRTPDLPFYKRIITTEGDVGDTTLTNTILPAIDVLNALIHPELQQDLIIVPSSQMTTTIDFLDQRKGREVSSRISLDHALVLVSKRSFDMNCDAARHEILVIVEEKKTPYVEADQWRDDALDRGPVKCHLPQILMQVRFDKPASSPPLELTRI
ncbi:hypothetical protein JCM3766R1_003736 [Sporobolomyces carnicolor]